MKRLLYILLCLPFWLACTDENLPVSNTDIEEGKLTEIRMSVALQGMNVASRALTEDITDFPSLWIVTFDKDGYFVEKAKATDLTLVENGTYHETEFSVTLRVTREPRILHFIANYADDLTLQYGHESNVIGSLSVNGDHDVYWHRKVLSEGINTDEEYIENNFRRIPLLRNFAKITVKEDLANFTLTGFYVLNVPTSGTVAPYSSGQFVDYMAKNEDGSSTELAKGYSTLKTEGYIGTMPDNVTFSQTTAPNTWIEPDEAFYMYENTYRRVESGQADNTTSILIKGKYGTSDTETYYRADLTIPNVQTGLSEYYHILRNFHYELNITSVVAEGKSTPEAAIVAPANNNLSGSVQVQNLSNISDGTAKLEVEYTDMVLVTTDEVTLKYRFIPDIKSSSNYANNRIKIYKNENGKVISSYTPTDMGTIETDSEGWSTITIIPVGELPNSTQEEILTLYDETTKLRREVKYTLRRRLDMEVNCTPIVPSIAGSSVMVNICIPNGLNENLFPLEFAIESNTSATSTTLKQYISPTNNEVMAVTTGNSIVPNHTNERSYQYIKELTYNEYQQLGVLNAQRVFPVNFKTNIAESASTVYVNNKYFNPGSDAFINGTAHITSSEFTGEYYGLNQTAGLTINGSGTASVTTNLKPETQTITWTSGTFNKTNYQTSTWAERSMGIVSVTAGQTTYDYYLSAGPVRNILKMLVSSATLDGEALNSDITMRIYRDEQSAKEFTETQIMTEQLSAFAAAAMKTYQVENLKADDKFWFAYLGADGYIYYTSTEAKDLVTGASLNFESQNKQVLPVKMNLKFEGSTDIYGTNKNVTMIFTTNKVGEYTLSSPNNSLDFNSVETRASINDNILTVNEQDLNKEIVITCKTTHVSNGVHAKIVCDAEGKSIEIVADERTAPTLSNAKLSDTSAYYGESQNVTLTFDVSKPCTVTIALDAGLKYNDSTSEFEYYCSSAGTQTINLESIGWNTKEKATITLEVEGQSNQVVEVNGATRNKLYLKAKSVQYGSYENNWGGTIWDGDDVWNNYSVTITIGNNSATLTCQNLKNGSYVEIAEVEDEDTITISYNRTSNPGKGNYSQSGIEISDLQSGNFDVRLQKQ